MSNEWMELLIRVPYDDGYTLVDLMKWQFGLVEVDFCELQRPSDLARVEYGPADPPPRSPSGCGPHRPTG